MRGAKTACAFAPEKYPPMGAGMGGAQGVPLWGGGAVRCIFANTDGEKRFLKKSKKVLDIC